MHKVLLSIAGFDPTGGAGILLDLRIFQKLGNQGMALITAHTVQNTQEVVRVHQLDPGLIWDQYLTIRRDVDIRGIKVGMLGFQDNLEILERILDENIAVPIVIDPVFQASSGTWLFPEKAIPNFLYSIRGRASLLTPNMTEASMITGKAVNDLTEMERAAKQIFYDYKLPVLVKGGHLAAQATDLLFDGERLHTYQNPKFAYEVHGTGCCLSSAILSFLTNGHSLADACQKAADFTHTLIEDSLMVGKGQRLIDIPD